MFFPFIRRVYKSTRYISLRDRESAKLLHSIGVDGVPIDIVSDPVMGIRTQIDKSESQSHPTVIGVSVRPWRADRRDLLQISEALRGILQQRDDARLHFLLFHPSRDRLASQYIIEQMGEEYASRIRLFDTGDDPKELLKKVGACDLMIGMRLHSLIYAAAYQIPMIGISYDPKIDHFLQHIGMTSSGSTDDVQTGRIMEQALTLLDQKRDWTDVKKQRIEDLREKSQIPAQQICHYLRIEQRMQV